MENSAVCRAVEALLQEDVEGVLCARVVNLIDPSEQERVLPSLIRILHMFGHDLAFSRKLVNEEVSQTLSEATLFRRNSSATKSATAMGKVLGAAYLRAVLSPIIADICEDNPSK